MFFLAQFYPIGRVGFRVKDSSAKVGTICIPRSFSASSIWRKSLSFLVVGSVNGWVTFHILQKEKNNTISSV